MFKLISFHRSGTPWYNRNHDLHRNLNIEFVDNIIKKYAEAHQNRFRHVNVEAIQLLDNTDDNSEKTQENYTVRVSVMYNK